MAYKFDVNGDGMNIPVFIDDDQLANMLLGKSKGYDLKYSFITTNIGVELKDLSNILKQIFHYFKISDNDELHIVSFERINCFESDEYIGVSFKVHDGKNNLLFDFSIVIPADWSQKDERVVVNMVSQERVVHFKGNFRKMKDVKDNSFFPELDIQTLGSNVLLKRKILDRTLGNIKYEIDFGEYTLSVQLYGCKLEDITDGVVPFESAIVAILKEWKFTMRSTDLFKKLKEVIGLNFSVSMEIKKEFLVKHKKSELYFKQFLIFDYNGLITALKIPVNELDETMTGLVMVKSSNEFQYEEPIVCLSAGMSQPCIVGKIKIRNEESFSVDSSLDKLPPSINREYYAVNVFPGVMERAFKIADDAEKLRKSLEGKQHNRN